MEPQVPAKADKRSIDELVNVALHEKDENAAWDAVRALHWHGAKDVPEAARGLCRTSCPRKRMVGADILGQIGVPERAFPEECVAMIRELLKEEDDATVLCSAFIALSHLGDPRAVTAAKQYLSHANPDVRHW